MNSLHIKSKVTDGTFLKLQCGKRTECKKHNNIYYQISHMYESSLGL